MIRSQLHSVDFVSQLLSTVRCTVSAVAALAVVTCSITSASAALTHRWAFEEPNGTPAPQVLDSVGVNHGTFVNMDDSNRANDWAPAFSASRSLLFDGVNETVTLASQIAFPQTSNYSVTFWYRGTETGETSDDWGRGLIGRDNNDLYSDLVLRGGKVEYVHYNGSWQHNIVSTILVNDNQWHHVAFVNHSTVTADLYIDGIQQVFGQPSDSSGVQFRIDGFMIGFPGRFSDGKLDDVRIYDSALTAAEVQELSQVLVPEPSSGLLLIGGLMLGRRYLKRQRQRKS